jgi:hypothetical protein
MVHDVIHHRIMIGYTGMNVLVSAIFVDVMDVVTSVGKMFHVCGFKTVPRVLFLFCHKNLLLLVSISKSRRVRATLLTALIKSKSLIANFIIR